MPSQPRHHHQISHRRRNKQSTQSLPSIYGYDDRSHDRSSVSKYLYRSRAPQENPILWFLKQISPGLVMVAGFLIFRSLDRATQLTLMGHAPPARSVATAAVEKDKFRLGQRVPKALQYLADLSTPYNPNAETPYFFDIHFAGESLAESVFAKCHFLIQACEHGLKQPNYNDEKLEVFETTSGQLYVNVDTTTKSGIRRAKSLKLAQSNLAQVMISPLLHLFSKSVFTASRRGRLFALFRHPVHRAISMKDYLSTASWDPMYNPSLGNMTLSDYAKSGSLEHNWVTRFLVEKPGGKLTRNDMLAAKEILRTKCLVGLFDDLESSLARFELYFGWSAKGREESQKCRKAVLETGDPRHTIPQVESNSEEFKAIAAANQWDMELYEYAKLLYVLQGNQIFGLGVGEQ